MQEIQIFNNLLYFIPCFFSSLWFMSNSKYILLSLLQRKLPTLYFGSSSVGSVMLAEWHTAAVKVHKIFSKQLLCCFGPNSRLLTPQRKYYSYIVILGTHQTCCWRSTSDFPSLTWHVKFQGPVPISLCTCQINVNIVKPNNDIVFHSFSGSGAAWLQWETSSQCLFRLTTVSSSTDIREQAKKRHCWAQWQILGTAVFVKALLPYPVPATSLMCLAYRKSHYS